MSTSFTSILVLSASALLALYAAMAVEEMMLSRIAAQIQEELK